MRKILLSALVVIALTAQLTGCNGNTPVEQPNENSSVVSDVSEPQSSTALTTSSTSETSMPQSSSTVTTSSVPEVNEPQSSTVSTTSEPETSSSESNSQSEETSKDDTPQWTETAVSGERYVNTDYISSRVTAIQGSNTVKQYRLNDKVTVVAKTDTNYYKLADGTFIHSDYLSESAVAVQQPGNDNAGSSVSSNNGEVRYVTEYCASRAEATIKSTLVRWYNVYDEVTVIAEADNGYSKLSDGTFIESVYLSASKPPVTQYTYQSGYELKHLFSGEKKKPSEGAIAEGLRQIGEEESGIDKLGYEVFGYWVELPSGKFWFCENNGGYYRSMEDVLNLKPHANSEAFPYDPSIGNGIHLS